MGAVNIAFKAQLVVPEQRQLYDYWLGCAGGQDMPSRADINPAQISRLLPYISLIDLDEDIGRSTVRLAGTRLRDVYDREITGLCLDELDYGSKRDYWMAAYRHTALDGKPVQAVLLFLVPVGQLQKHLHILANIAGLLHRDDFRKKFFDGFM